MQLYSVEIFCLVCPGKVRLFFPFFPLHTLINQKQEIHGPHKVILSLENLEYLSYPWTVEL